MQFEPLVTLGFLVGLYYAQVKLIQALVEAIKALGATGKKLIGWSYLSGVVVGLCLFVLAYSELSQYPIQSQVAIGVLFLLTSGLAASGFYDLGRD